MVLEKRQRTRKIQGLRKLRPCRTSLEMAPRGVHQIHLKMRADTSPIQAPIAVLGHEVPVRIGHAFDGVHGLVRSRLQGGPVVPDRPHVSGAGV